MSDSRLELPRIESEIWRGLSAACTEPGNTWRLPVLATVGARGGPHARTIVLRNINAAERSLVFHTDVRSPKIEQLREDNRVSVVFYDPSAMTQVTVLGTATVHTDDSTADAEWYSAAASSRRGYLAPQPPGTRVQQPDSNLPDSVIGRVPTEQELANARPNFAVIVVAATEIDWLKLDREANFRARFDYSSGDPVAQWVAV